MARSIIHRWNFASQSTLCRLLAMTVLIIGPCAWAQRNPQTTPYTDQLTGRALLRETLRQNQATYDVTHAESQGTKTQVAQLGSILTAPVAADLMSTPALPASSQPTSGLTVLNGVPAPRLHSPRPLLPVEFRVPTPGGILARIIMGGQLATTGSSAIVAGSVILGLGVNGYFGRDGGLFSLAVGLPLLIGGTVSTAVGGVLLGTGLRSKTRFHSELRLALKDPNQHAVVIENLRRSMFRDHKSTIVSGVLTGLGGIMTILGALAYFPAQIFDQPHATYCSPPTPPSLCGSYKEATYAYGVGVPLITIGSILTSFSLHFLVGYAHSYRKERALLDALQNTQGLLNTERITDTPPQISVSPLLGNGLYGIAFAVKY